MIPPRLALIGPPSQVSPWLLAAAARVGRFEAVCDPAAEEQPLPVPARWIFTDVAKMLRETEPDGVILHRPIAERPGLIKQCLATGVAVLLTGVPGPASACRRLDSMGRVASKAVLAASAARYAPATRQARRVLEGGRFGLPVSMSVRSTWPRSAGTGGGPPQPVEPDQIFEAVDLVALLLGNWRQVYAVAHEAGVLIVAGTTASGVVVQMECHAGGEPEAVGLEIELWAADGTWLRIDRERRLVCARGSRVEGWHRPTLPTVDPAVELGYESLLADFRRRMAEGRKAGFGLVPPAAAAAAVGEAILASAAKGRPMNPQKTASEADLPEAILPSLDH